MNRAISAAGIAKQASKGVPAVNPTFWHGVTGGKMVDFEVDQKPDEVTTGLGGVSHFNRESVAVGADYSTRAFLKALGLYLLGVLGNVQTTGAAAPYTHVFTLGDSVPWLTLFSKLDTELRAAGDCKIDELSIAWEGTKPLDINVTAMGCVASWPAIITVPVGDERLGAYFLPVGGSYEIDVDGVTRVAYPVLGGKITFKRSLEADIYSASVVPGDVNEGALEVEVEIKVRAATLADQRLILTGAVGGTTISETPVFGSFETTFVAGTASLALLGTRVPFTCETPEADPKGGPAELALKGPMLIPVGGTSPITATLTNDVATY